MLGIEQSYSLIALISVIIVLLFKGLRFYIREQYRFKSVPNGELSSARFGLLAKSL